MALVCLRCNDEHVISVPGPLGDRVIPCPECRPDTSPVATHAAVERQRTERVHELARPAPKMHATLEQVWTLMMRMFYADERIVASDIRTRCVEAGLDLPDWRALGPLMMRAERKGYIVDSGAKEQHPAHRDQMQTVYRSLLVRGE